MNVATVLLNSEPDSMILKHNGIISVVNRNVITSCSSVLTKAPMTPKLVSLKYSNGLVLEVVCKKGYRNNGICACKNTDRVSGWDATHCNKANALHTLLDWWAVKVAGFIDG